MPRHANKIPATNMSPLCDKECPAPSRGVFVVKALYEQFLQQKDLRRIMEHKNLFTGTLSAD